MRLLSEAVEVKAEVVETEAVPVTIWDIVEVEAEVVGGAEDVVAVEVTVSVGVVVVELVVLKTVPEGVVTTTTLGGVMATCGGSEVGG